MEEIPEFLVQLPLALPFSTSLELFTHHQPLCYHAIGGLPAVALQLPLGFQLSIQPIPIEALSFQEHCAKDLTDTSTLGYGHVTNNDTQQNTEMTDTGVGSIMSSAIELVLRLPTSRYLNVMEDLLDSIQDVRALHLAELHPNGLISLHASKAVDSYELLEDGASCQ